MIYSGYIVKYSNGYERIFSNQAQLTLELRMCRKSIYTSFKRGYANLKDLSIEKVFKIKNGVVMDKFINKEIEKYNEVVGNVEY